MTDKNPSGVGGGEDSHSPTPQALLEHLLSISPEKVLLSHLRIHEVFQPRNELLIPLRQASSANSVKGEHIDSLLLKLKGMEDYELDPILVASIGEERLVPAGLYVLDGHHRIAAYQRANRRHILARQISLDFRAALMISKLANCNRRSLRMHEEERREAAWQTLVIATEGGQTPVPKAFSTRKVAAMFDISKNTAQRMIKRLREINPKDYQKSDLAAETGWPRWHRIREHRSSWDAHLARLPEEERAVLDARCLIGKICDLLNKSRPGVLVTARRLLLDKETTFTQQQEHGLDLLLDLLEEDPLRLAHV